MEPPPPRPRKTPAPAVRKNPKSKEQDSDGSSSESEDEPLVHFDDSKEKGAKKAKQAEDEDGDEDIEVDFEFFDPKPTDAYAIRQFLSNYTESPGDFKSSELADVVCVQASVGAMIKADSMDQPLGYISAINLHRHKDLESVKQIKKYFLSKANGTSKTKMEALFNDPKRQLGLLLSERIVNLPMELVPPLHQVKILFFAGFSHCPDILVSHSIISLLPLGFVPPSIHLPST